MDELDEYEMWESIATEICELKKHRDILGDSLDFIDDEDDLLTDDR